MTLLQNLTPVNLLEEKAKFFADQKYNPQFLYENPIDPQSLVQYGFPTPKLLALADQILKKSYYGRNEEDLYMMEGKNLNQEEVAEKIKIFLEMHNLQDKYEIVWSSSFVSRATISSTALKLRLPCEFRKEGLLGMLYHEIGTHALRRINYEKQPWFKKKKKYEMSEYLYTEEGLASLHSLIPHSFKMAYIPATRYIAVDFAQKHSFAEVWQKLGAYIQDPERRWNITFREKRGLTDTSEPGGFTKDLVYFQGMVKTWQWLKKNNFDLTGLYYGKMAAEDVEKAKVLYPDFKPMLPSFYKLDPQRYLNNISEIGQINQLDQI